MKKQLLVASAMASVLLLTGCSGDKNSSITVTELEKKQAALGNTSPKNVDSKNYQGQEVLITVDGTPAVYESDLEEYTQAMLNAQPENVREQYRQILAAVPMAKKNIAISQANEKALDIWADKEKIFNDSVVFAELQQQIAQAEKMARINIIVKRFQDTTQVAIGVDEARKYYDENKDSLADLMISQGGVKTKMVTFSTNDAAKKFIESLKGKSTEFDNAAANAKLEIKDLGFVNDKSLEVEGPVRTKIIALNSLPTVELIKVNDTTFAVVYAESKQEAQYVPFEQIKTNIEEMLKQQRVADALVKKLEELKKKYKIVINEDYFNRQSKAVAPQNAPAEAVQ